MSLYHETAAILSTPATHGGSLKSRIFGNRSTGGGGNGNGIDKKSDDAGSAKTGLKSPPAQVYALALESCKWSGVLKEVIEGAELLGRERKVRFPPPQFSCVSRWLLFGRRAWRTGMLICVGVYLAHASAGLVIGARLAPGQGRRCLAGFAWTSCGRGAPQGKTYLGAGAGTAA